MRYVLCLPLLFVALLTSLPAAATDPDEISRRMRVLLDRKLEVQFAELLDRSERRITASLQLKDPYYHSIGSSIEALPLAGLSRDGGALVPAPVADPLGYLGGSGQAAKESDSNKGSADRATRLTCAVTDSKKFL